MNYEPAEPMVRYCPVCGAKNPEKIYVAPGEGPVGCDECLCAWDAWEYFEEGR